MVLKLWQDNQDDKVQLGVGEKRGEKKKVTEKTTRKRSPGVFQHD